MAIVVADLHGDVEKTQAFLNYQPEVPHVALGDYLDSFIEPPDRQLECLQLLMDSTAVLLLGNHECHYLKKPLFRFEGYNMDFAQIFQDTLEANIERFKVAHAVDGWLCTHAGVQGGIAERINDADKLAKLLNNWFEQYLVNRFLNKNSPYLYQTDLLQLISE